jgi:PKD repeat protein
MQFNDLSTAAAGNTIVSWAWDFGDSQIATQQNPIHIYSDTGSYKVKLNIITDGGCSNQFSKIVKVYPYPQIAIFASNACEQSTVQFSNTLLTFGYPITKWSWTFGDPSSGSSNFSTLQNPAHLYVAQGNYQSQLIIQNSFGCADTAITTVTIKPKPTADFNYSFACKNDSIQFTNSSLLPTATSLQKTYWNFGDNSTSLLGNPKHKYISAVTYHASFIVTASNGCSDTTRKTITVNDNPIAYFSTSNACVNSPVNFNDFSVISNGTIANWLWEIDSMMLSNVKNPSYTFTKVGNANVQLEVTSDKGCKNKTNKTIVIHSAPVASFSLTPSYGNPPFAVNFTNTSNGALSYVWNFGDGNTSILQNPTNTYKDTGSFKVTLTIKNNLGCVNAVSKTVNSLKKLVDVKVQDISAVFKNDFLNITVQLVNKGTADITKLDLYIKVNDGPEVKEEWSGLLLRGGALIHTFKASVSLKDDNHYVCVTAANPNGLDDEDPSNNKLCKGINVNTFQVFELYPNPVKEAISVTLPLVIPKKELLTITIYDCNGKFVKTAFSEVLTEGLQLVNISVIGLKSGLYACKIEYRKESVIKKMILY